jgi:anti-sigma B factor antagonist
MEIARREAAGEQELWVSGRVDAFTATALDAALDELARLRPPRVALRMTEVDFFGSAGVRSLVRYRKKASEWGGTLRVADASEAVRAVLDLVGLGPLLA